MGVLTPTFSMLPFNMSRPHPQCGHALKSAQLMPDFPVSESITKSVQGMLDSLRKKEPLKGKHLLIFLVLP
jgi:hypothetical protein